MVGSQTASAKIRSRKGNSPDLSGHKIMKVGKWITYKAHQMHSIANKLNFGKAFTVVGKKPLNADMAMTRIGLPLEIVPLKDPKTIKAGEAFPLQIFYKDQPLAGETIIATSDTFVVKDMEAATSHREPQAFSGKTDSEGKVNFIPLIEGVWKLKVIHKEPFEDQKVCQQSANYATLILPVGKARAKLPPKPEHHHH